MSQFPSGTKIGPYEIVSQIGAGGMGEVYRATDTRLKRQVALKVLPGTVTSDPDRVARFQREAEVLASLNHPHIAALYGLEENSGVNALVMELVEGPTLADRIAQGPIPIEEALSIARQIAEALAAAHEQGVVHRDLKPANIKLRPDGDVKVLDFGLAKAMDQDPKTSGPQGLANSPTITSPAMTMRGVILGTAAYMSPEQAAGKPVDRRSDLWAFGIVLMEMLTGKSVFEGETVSHVIAAVLKDEPDWNALPPATPAAIHRLLRRCLERDRKKRWPDAATARMECEDALVSGSTTASVAGSAAAARSPWHLPGALVVGIVIASVAAWTRWPAAASPSTISRFEIELPDGRVFTRAGRHVMAISPDGTQIAYVANRQIYLRALSDTNASLLAGTAESNATEPVFSPDGKWLAFWSNGQMKKVPVSGGTAITLAETENPLGVSWTGDQILVGAGDPGTARDVAARVLAVPANGGPARTLVTVADDEFVQSPQLVNDGKAVLFTLRKGDSPWQDASIVVQDLATGMRTVVIEHGTDARLTSAGYLIYERESTLFAMAFDERRLAVSGSPVPVQTNVREALGNFSGAAQAVVSNNGSLVFVPAGASANRVLMWLDRNGATERLKVPPALHYVGRSQKLSPDGTRLASRVAGDSAVSDIWIGELKQGIFRKLTFAGRTTDPVWSTDGSRVCYELQDDVLCQPADGSGSPRSLFKWPRISTLEEFSPDGRWLLFTVQPDTTARLVTMIADTQSPSDVRPLIRDNPYASVPAVSRDGKLVAYESGDSPHAEVYVRPFPGVDGGLWQVSSAGGNRPNWSHSGRELFYLVAANGGRTSDVTIMKVAITSGPTFSAGAPEPVVKLPPNAAFNFSVAADGRFLINVPATDSAAGRERLVVVQNWFEELKTKVPR